MFVTIDGKMIELNDDLIKRYDELTPIQRGVAIRVLEGTKKCDAYRQTCEVVDGETPEIEKCYSGSARVLANRKVQDFMNDCRAIRMSLMIMKREEMASRLSGIARTNIDDILDIAPNRELMDPETGELFPGQTTWSLKRPEEMRNAGVTAISELSATNRGLTVKTHDQLRAMKQLSELMGYDKPQQHEHTVKRGLNDLYDEFEEQDKANQ